MPKFTAQTWRLKVAYPELHAELHHKPPQLLLARTLQLPRNLCTATPLLYAVSQEFAVHGPAAMSASPQSAKRRHILSSINPDRPAKRHRSEEPASPEGGQEPEISVEGAKSPRREHDDAGANGSDTTRPRRTRLRLKKDRSRRRSSRDRDHDDSARRSRHRRHHHRHRRRERSPTPPNPLEPPPLDPEAAFRESLFDAMADDEGAAYWEGVYGQPVHVYANERVGPAGELEQMTDEEYAAHVRQKMWEKTHTGLLEERARQDEARKRKKEEERRGRKLREDMEDSLRRGEERRHAKMWALRWDEYSKAWASWDGSLGTLAWPLENGRRADIDEKAVRSFFVHGMELEKTGEASFASKLRDERVRWHPDKIQQRLGGNVDDEVMKDVTAIFQIIDRLWTESRSKA